jgi:hypothetical protein
MNTFNKWSITDQKIIYHHPEMDVYWKIPIDFLLPSESVLSLAEFILLQPHGVTIDIIPDSKINKHGNIAVAYSGGVDSTAALELIPGAIPIYTKVRPKGFHKLDNALLALEEVNGHAIESNYDEFPLIFGKRVGFFGLGGFTITCVLFSEYFNLKTICDGNVLETAYLYSSAGHGTKFNPRNQSKIFNAFNMAGLQYCMPCAGLTEVSTTKIAKNYNFAMGCMRGIGGNTCNKCIKCYRKRALQGIPLPSNSDVEKKLSSNLIPMLPSLLWARNHNGLSHPLLNSIDKNVDWVDQWYSQSLEFIPLDMQQTIKDGLLRHSINELKDATHLENWISDSHNGN